MDKIFRQTKDRSVTASPFNNQQAKFQVSTAKMGQALSSCVPCLGNDDDAAPSINEAEMLKEKAKLEKDLALALKEMSKVKKKWTKFNQK